MKNDILIKMLFVMLAKKKVTANYLASRFDIAIRSVYRYIDTLTLANIPIISNRGNGGGYEIASSYRLPMSFFTENEYNIVVSTLNSYNKTAHSQDLATAIEKLLSNKREDTSSISIHAENIIIDTNYWGRDSNNNSIFTILNSAVLNQNQVNLAYHNRKGEITSRTVNPYSLILKRGIWYLFGYCMLKKDFRLFKVGRVEYCNLLNSNFEKVEFDPKFLKLDDWYNSLDLIEVDFVLSSKIKGDIQEWLGIDAISTTKSGKIVASAKLPNDRSLILKILSFGSLLTLVSPPELKDKLAEEIALLNNKYNKKV